MTLQRFKSRCEITPQGCWIWQGSKKSNGYGTLTYRYRPWLTHRWAYTQWRGPIPDHLCVCHSCDTPACVNPDHLWLGTQQANIRDAQQKGRIPTATTKPPSRTVDWRELTGKTLAAWSKEWAISREGARLRLKKIWLTGE